VIDIQFDSDSVHFHCGTRTRAASQHRPLHCSNRHEQGARSHTKRREKITIGVGGGKNKSRRSRRCVVPWLTMTGQVCDITLTSSAGGSAPQTP
jgi:hypothetical protein